MLPYNWMKSTFLHLRPNKSSEHLFITLNFEAIKIIWCSSDSTSYDLIGNMFKLKNDVWHSVSTFCCQGKTKWNKAWNELIKYSNMVVAYCTTLKLVKRKYSRSERQFDLVNVKWISHNGVCSPAYFQLHFDMKSSISIIVQRSGSGINQDLSR